MGLIKKLGYSVRVILIACLVFSLSAGLGFTQYYEEEETAPAPQTFKAPINVPKATSVSMDFQDAPLGTVLKVLSEQTGINFVAGQTLQEKRVSLFLDNVSVQEALDTILRSINLTYEQVGPETSNIYIIKESGKPEVETKTKVFTLSFAPAGTVTEKTGDTAEQKITGLDEVIKQMITDKGKVIVDTRTNSLIVNDIPSQLKLIEDIVTQLDTKTPQVMIETEVLETSADLLKELGFEWGTGVNGRMFQIYGAASNTGWPFGNLLDLTKAGTSLVAPDVANFAPPQNTATVGEPRLGAISFNYLQVALDAIERNAKTKILARPKVLTLDNKTAEIKITTQTAIGSITAITGGGTGITSSTTQAERVETGIVLKVTPQINKDNFITMLIEPSVTTTTRSRFFPDTFVDPQTRSTKTTVMVKDGDTIVIGGLMNEEDVETIRKVPVLGDVPILGLGFRKESRARVNRELVVFLTPHLVKETVPGVEPKTEETIKWEPAPIVPEEQMPAPKPKPVVKEQPKAEETTEPVAEPVKEPVVKEAKKLSPIDEAKRDTEMEKALKDLGAEPIYEEEEETETE